MAAGWAAPIVNGTGRIHCALIQKPIGFQTIGLLFLHIFAAGLGFEPRYQPPKGCVLPLDDPAMFTYNYQIIF